MKYLQKYNFFPLFAPCNMKFLFVFVVFVFGLSYLCHRFAVVAQLVEHQLPKLRATGSSPAYRSKKGVIICLIAPFVVFFTLFYTSKKNFFIPLHRFQRILNVFINLFNSKQL